MKRYARFARSHRELLTRAHKTYAQVALVYSIPSFMFKHCGALGWFPGRSSAFREQWAHFQGFATVLERLHIPYEVLIFGGEPSLWDDSDALRALSAYRLAILPNVEAMTARQADAVGSYLRSGGRVLFSGKLAERDEMFARLPKPRLAQIARRGATQVSKGRAVGLSDEPARIGTTPQAACGALQLALVNQTKPQPLTVSAWSKAEGVAEAGAHYSLWIDAEYQDGTRGWFGAAPFRPGTHGWQRVEKKLVPRKPIKMLKVYLLLRYTYAGTAWFDDVSVTAEGSSQNLILNPSFETDEEWKPYARGFEWDDRAARTGKRSIRCTIPKRPFVDNEAASKIRRALDELLPPSERVMQTSAPSEVFINPLLRGNRLIVHFLNMDWRRSDDTVAEKTQLAVKLRTPSSRQLKSETAHFASPALGDGDLRLRLGGDSVQFTLARLRVWTVVSLDME